MEKTCLNCGKEFQGRLNQKFCGTKCKNHFHNVRNREKESVLIQLNKVLHKNWTVLHSMYSVYRSKPINMNILEANGFDSKYHTHTFNSPIGEKYTMIYDLGYKPHFDNQIQIVQADV